MEADRLIAWGEELRRVHGRLRQALQIARDSIDDPSAGPAAISGDLLLFCRGFCTALHGHHRSEDMNLFPKLITEHPDLANVVAKLSQDHSMIDYLLGALDNAITKGASGQELLRHLDGIEAVMETHFRFEEKKLLGVLDGMRYESEDRQKLLGPIA